MKPELHNYNETKVIATLGPSSDDLDTIRALIRSGVDCFRINFSHGTGATLSPLMKKAREAAALENTFIPILADIQGPKIRIGRLPGDGITLREGQTFTVTTAVLDEGDETRVSTSYAFLAKDVEVGGRILLADGAMELRVEKINGDDVECGVVIGGQLFSNKGMNLPGTKLSVETLTEKDRADLAYIASADVDMVAISFVRSRADMDAARAILSGSDRTIPVMAKLERPEAMQNLDEILECSDGVMIARGDLGVELEFERVPLLQKKILERAAVRGKWTVVATQMLGSMTRHNRPTRAEVSDIANAVLDGADAVMLSEETAAGKHPVAAVDAMVRIAREAESRITFAGVPKFDPDIVSFAAGAAGAAVSAAGRLKARAIVALAGSGLTALLVSKWHPEQMILALSAKEPTLRRLNVLRGVVPVPMEEHADMETQIALADRYLLEANLAVPGDRIIVVAAVPLGKGAETNTVRFHRVRAQN